MYYDTDDTWVLIKDALACPDTGFVPAPIDLIGVKQAAAHRGLSERTMRRRCERHGIAIKIDGIWRVAVQGLDALMQNDTGALCDIQHDMETIRGLTSWPTMPSTWRALGVTPETAPPCSSEDTKMSISGAPLHTEIIHLRVPAGMTAALQYVARKRAQRMPELIRQELLDRLVAEGWAIDAAGRITDTGQPT